MRKIVRELNRIPNEIFESDGEIIRIYTHFFVMKRPESFPPRGTAEITIRQRLLHFDYVIERTETLNYSIYD